MPLHPTDLQNFENTFPGQVPSADFEREYEIWLSTKHRFRSAGPLNELMVPLCRMFALAPPHAPTIAAATPASQINWSRVPRGHRVVAALPNGEVARGEFRNIGFGNRLEIKLDGVEWVQELPPHAVRLDVETTTAPPTMHPNARVETLADAIRDADGAGLPGASAASAPSTAPSASPLVDQANGQSPAAYPQMSDSRWYDVAEGKLIKVKRAGKLVNARFLKVGPSDHEIAAVVNNETDVSFFAEEVAVYPEKKRPGRQKGSKHVRKTPRGTQKITNANGVPALA